MDWTELIAFHFLGTKDRHLMQLFHWINVLEELADEVRISDQNRELEDELMKLSNRLIHEVGIRTISIFPCGKDWEWEWESKEK